LRASLAAECHCGSTTGPKRYVRCVKSHIKSLVRLRQLPPACRKPILRCESDSTCGRPMAVACCKRSGPGQVEGRIVHVASECHGDVCASARSAREACTSDGRCLSDFDGITAGESRTIAGIDLAWCPAASFRMGSPSDEPERRPDEGQVEVTL